jgi:hypothetical protein
MKLDKMSEYGLLMATLSTPDPERLVEVRDTLRDRMMTANDSSRRFRRLGACVPGINTLFWIVQSHRDFAFGTIFSREDFIDHDEVGDEIGDDGTTRLERFRESWKAAELATDAMISVGFEHIGEVDYEDPAEGEEDG